MQENGIERGKQWVHVLLCNSARVGLWSSGKRVPVGVRCMICHS